MFAHPRPAGLDDIGYRVPGRGTGPPRARPPRRQCPSPRLELRMNSRPIVFRFSSGSVTRRGHRGSAVGHRARRASPRWRRRSRVPPARPLPPGEPVVDEDARQLPPIARWTSAPRPRSPRRGETADDPGVAHPGTNPATSSSITPALVQSGRDPRHDRGSSRGWLPERGVPHLGMPLDSDESARDILERGHGRPRVLASTMNPGGFVDRVAVGHPHRLPARTSLKQRTLRDDLGLRPPELPKTGLRHRPPSARAINWWP